MQPTTVFSFSATLANIGAGTGILTKHFIGQAGQKRS